MKKLISALCAVVMTASASVAVLPKEAFENTIVTNATETSGKCGANLTWALDGSILTISGTGPMYNYSGETLGGSARSSYPKSNAPWGSLSSEIKSVVIGEQVTSIGAYAFFGCSAVTEISLPESILSIGQQAFDWCSNLIALTILNPNCDIYADGLTICAGRPAYSSCVLRGYDGSSAQVYANKWGLQFDTIDSQKQVSIPDNAFEYNGHSYYVYPTGTCSTWDETVQFCEELGGYLATINDAEENEALFSYLTEIGTISAYFGFSDSDNEGTWKWIHDYSDYTNWHEGEPNAQSSIENYAMFYYRFDDGTWNDGDFVYGEKSFICEWDQINGNSNNRFSYEESMIEAMLDDESAWTKDIKNFMDVSNHFFWFQDLDFDGNNELIIGGEGNNQTGLNYYFIYKFNKKLERVYIEQAGYIWGKNSFTPPFSLFYDSISKQYQYLIYYKMYASEEARDYIDLFSMAENVQRMIACHSYPSDPNFPYDIEEWRIKYDSYPAVSKDEYDAYLSGYMNGLQEVSYNNDVIMLSDYDSLNSREAKYNRLKQSYDAFSYEQPQQNKISWLVDGDGNLRIFGTGEISYTNGNAPWTDKISQIKSIVIEEGITGICVGAFQNYTKLQKIYIPNGVTEIPAEAFSGCTALEEIHIPRSLAEIGVEAFINTKLNTIYFGGVKSDTAIFSGTGGAGVFGQFDQWHYLDEYYYPDKKLYGQLLVLNQSQQSSSDYKKVYGNSQTEVIIRDYRNMAIVDNEAVNYRTWSHHKDLITDGYADENDYNEKLTVEAILAQLLLNSELYNAVGQNTEVQILQFQLSVLESLADQLNNEWSYYSETIEFLESIDKAQKYTENPAEYMAKAEWLLKNGFSLADKSKVDDILFADVDMKMGESVNVVMTALNAVKKYCETKEIKRNNIIQCYNLCIYSIIYFSVNSQYADALLIMKKHVEQEYVKYQDDDEFAEHMKRVSNQFIQCYEMIIDYSSSKIMEYLDENNQNAEEIGEIKQRLNLGKGIVIAYVTFVCPEVAAIIGGLELALEFGMDVWEICSNVEERALARDKFLNMILFYDAFSNALYDTSSLYNQDGEYCGGFFGKMLSEPTDESYQLYVTGVKMYLAVQDMLIDYAIDYSNLLRPELEEWDDSKWPITSGHIVDKSDSIKRFYHARYPEKETSGRFVHECWKELDHDMADDVLELIKVMEVYVENAEDSGLKVLYYLKESDAERFGVAVPKWIVAYRNGDHRLSLITRHILCPVDLIIRHGDEIVAKVENDEITLNNDEVFLRIYKESEDEYSHKFMILPEGYDLEITGFAAGEMNIIKNTILPEKTISTVIYSSVPVTAGASYQENTADALQSIICDLDGDGEFNAKVYQYYEPGDINEDGDILIADAVLLSRVLAEDTTIEVPYNMLNCDVNGDQILTIFDVIMVLGYLSGAVAISDLGPVSYRTEKVDSVITEPVQTTTTVTTTTTTTTTTTSKSTENADVIFDIRSADSNEITINANTLANGDYSVPVEIYIPRNSGINAATLKFQVNDGEPDADGMLHDYGFYLSNAGFASPYCFDSANGGNATFAFDSSFTADQSMNLSWIYSNDPTILADSCAVSGITTWVESVSWATDYAFAVCTLVIPKGTASGTYVFDIRREQYVNPNTIGTDNVKYIISKVVAGDELLSYGTHPLKIVISDNSAVGFEPYGKGDLNLDGLVNAEDYELMDTFLAIGDVFISDQGLKNADLNDDNSINYIDLELLNNYIMQKSNAISSGMV